ncbi:MAG TPA: flagellar motor protein MotB [Terracidiphilus sp.]|nr:flagellar motor protein MotB [Terracidiphilus sp.]
MASAKSQPIIIIKKKAGHGGHHGGAWKVAYADFVTAMMSLFIVLWLMNTSEPIRKAVAGYFNDPRGIAKLEGTTLTGTGETVTRADPNAAALQRLKAKLEKEIAARKDLEKLKKQIQITITSEGLRIEMLEGKDGTFYENGSAQLSANGQELLVLLASELSKLPNKLQIEGHTDARQYAHGANYTNWELSADRANAARRLMQQHGVAADQVTQVRAYADQMLRDRNDPLDPSNRRITILVKNRTTPIPGLQASAGNSHNGTQATQPSPPQKSVDRVAH